MRVKRLVTRRFVISLRVVSTCSGDSANVVRFTIRWTTSREDSTNAVAAAELCTAFSVAASLVYHLSMLTVLWFVIARTCV
jgi:hypothetical protein